MHSFENRRVSISEFSSCVTSEDGCGIAVPYLQNDSAGDFQHSKQCKYKDKYLSKFSNVHKRKQTSLLAKVNSRFFFLFPAAMLVPMVFDFYFDGVTVKTGNRMAEWQETY